MFTLKKITIVSAILILFFILGVSCTPMKNIVLQGTSTIPELTKDSLGTVAIYLTPSLTPTSTITVIPTLSQNDAQELLLKTIQVNGNCKLPCLLGITPGVSTSLDAYNIFLPLNGIAHTNLNALDSGYVDYKLPIDDLFIYVNIHYLPINKDGSIRMINISTDALKQNGNGFEDMYGALSYNNLFVQYSLQNLLSIYGPPTQVELDADIHKFEPTAPTYFYFYLLYPEKGIYARYTTSAKEVAGDKIQSCPSKAFVELWLMPPENNNSNEQLLSSDNAWGYPHKSLEEAAKISINQFYDMFKNSSDQCLTTQRSQWDPMK